MEYNVNKWVWGKVSFVLKRFFFSAYPPIWDTGICRYSLHSNLVADATI